MVERDVLVRTWVIRIEDIGKTSVDLCLREPRVVFVRACQRKSYPDERAIGKHVSLRIADTDPTAGEGCTLVAESLSRIRFHCWTVPSRRKSFQINIPASDARKNLFLLIK